MIRGWCPTVHAPMRTGDGLLVRVKPFGGRLPAAALAALAEAASTYGNGAVQLTSRGNLQVRGVRDPEAFARAMVAAGLADADADREARRNVIAVPPCDDALVAEAEAVLAQTPGLPAKFCVVVHGDTITIDGLPVSDLRHALATAARTSGSSAQPSPQGKGLIPSLAGGGRGEGRATHLLYLPNNQVTAQTLAHLATLVARSHAALAGEIRTTPWRALLSPVPAPGFLAEPGTVTACPGAPACSSATTRTQTDGATLQQAGHRHIHISGCSKGCAYAAATTTLVGRNGRYDLVRHGRASDAPDLRGLTLAEAMAAL